MYAYFAVYYYDEEIFNVIMNRVFKFKNFPELRPIFGSGGNRVYHNLTSSKTSIIRIRLNQITFEAALDKDYQNIAVHFIQSSAINLTWNMVRKMLKQKQEYLVKQCIKFSTVFDSGDASTKKI